MTVIYSTDSYLHHYLQYRFLFTKLL